MAADMTRPTEDIAGYSICTLPPARCVSDMTEWIERGAAPGFFACANPHSLVVAEQRPEFKAALSAADWLTPDGQGILLASRMAGGAIRERVTGADVFEGLSRALSERGGYRVFFLGSSERTLEAMTSRFAREFPKLEIAGSHSPPFAEEFTQAQMDGMVERVNQAKTDVLWVGMTAPKQELWIHENLPRLEVKFIGAIGAVFDFFAGTKERPALFYQKLGLEWLVRVMREPRRLGHRVLVSVPQFARIAARHAIASRFRKQT